jgi:peroxiredoxin
VEFLAQLRELLPQFDSLGASVTCVVQGTAEEAARFCGRHALAGHCIPDPEKASYRAMGLPRTRLRDMVFASPVLKRRRAEAAAAGCSVDLAGAMLRQSDWLQLPGAAVIARGGKIVWLHRGQDPADLPSPAKLLEVARTSL